MAYLVGVNYCVYLSVVAIAVKSEVYIEFAVGEERILIAPLCVTVN